MGREGGKGGGQNNKKKTYGVSLPKRPFSFWDHDTVKILCGRLLQDIPPST